MPPKRTNLRITPTNHNSAVAAAAAAPKKASAKKASPKAKSKPSPKASRGRKVRSPSPSPSGSSSNSSSPRSSSSSSDDSDDSYSSSSDDTSSDDSTPKKKRKARAKKAGAKKAPAKPPAKKAAAKRTKKAPAKAAGKKKTAAADSTALQPAPKLDALTCGPLEKNYIEFKTDSGEILYYNTSSLINASKPSGEWKQPPDFKSPMSEELKHELAAKERVADVTAINILPSLSRAEQLFWNPPPAALIQNNRNELMAAFLAKRTQQQQILSQLTLTAQQEQLYLVSRVVGNFLLHELSILQLESVGSTESFLAALSMLATESEISLVFEFAELPDLVIRELIHHSPAVHDILSWGESTRLVMVELLPMLRGVQERGPAEATDSAAGAEKALEAAAEDAELHPDDDELQEELEKAQQAARDAANEAVLAEIAGLERVREERKARAKQLLRERQQQQQQSEQQQSADDEQPERELSVQTNDRRRDREE